MYPPAHPTHTLISEHRLIEQVLNCLERMVEAGQQHGSLDAPSAADAIAFFKTVVHQWHFPREEAFLNAAIDPAGQFPGVDFPFRDHQRCRQHLAGMEQALQAVRAGTPGAAERFAEHAHAYIAILMKHHEDEEDRVFPKIERAAAGKTNPDTAARWASLPQTAVSQDQLDACIKIAHRLADLLNVPRSEGARVAAARSPAPPSRQR